MTKWTVDLKGAEAPIYLALAERIARAIESRQIAPASRLPTHRRLAHELGISVHTVSNAYAELERRGYVVGEVGRGTFVNVSPGPEESRFILDRRDHDLIDMSILRPASGRIHAEAVRATLRQMADGGEHAALLACRPIAGQERHRSAGATWLARLGLAVTPDRVLIVNGCSHGLLVALSALTKPNDAVATEAITDYGIIALANLLHVQLHGIECDGKGLIPDAFERACRSADMRVLVTTPNYTNPTATVMPEGRRRRIAEIAQAHDVAIVEDDVFGPLLPEPLPPLSSFAPATSVYITSLTKTVMSGLRVGYLVAPEALVPRIVTRIRATSWMATPIVADIAARWIEDRTIGALVDWQKAELAARLDIALRHLGGYGLRARPNTPHVFITLPPRWRAENFAIPAKLRGLAVTPSEPFVVGRLPQPQAIRIALGAASSRAQLDEGVAGVAALMAETPEPEYLDL